MNAVAIRTLNARLNVFRRVNSIGVREYSEHAQ